MDPKIQNIMKHLADQFGIKSTFVREDDYGGARYELFTDLAAHDHRTVVEFEISSDILRLNVIHLFGCLTGNVSSQDLLRLLEENNGQFKTTAAYLGARIIEGTRFLTLNSYHHFHMKWEDPDIADIMRLQIFDIKMGFLFDWGLPCIQIFTQKT